MALQLYRSILKAHKKYLPYEMKQLGDVYVRSEFKLHKSASEPKLLQEFFHSWEEYLNHIVQTARIQESVSVGTLSSSSNPLTTPNPTTSTTAAAASFGKDLPSGIELTKEQQEKLSDLRKEATRKD